MPIEINCKTCNTLLKRKPFRLKKNKNQFCSIKCKSVFMEGKPTWNKGLKCPEISKGLRGRKLLEKTKRKISLNCRKYQTLDTRKNISKSMLGKKKTEEHSKNISKGKKGTVVSEKTKEKLSKIFEGNKSSLWKGGISFEPYGLDFTRRFKKSIRERDNCCMLCNVGFEDLKLLKRNIMCHHINYDKKLSIKENCITLCQPCHSKTNFNRIQWVTFFQSLLKEKYGYQYTEKQKVILEYV